MTDPSNSIVTPGDASSAGGLRHPASAWGVAILRSPGFMTFLVLAGVALRFWAYVSNAALWLDEILLSRSVLEAPLSDLLTRPLMLDQVAPRGFLLVEWLAVALFGSSEYALRLFPFLAGVAGVFLFRRLAERTLTGIAPVLALLMFAVGIPFIRYSAEVKQYELDVTVAAVLLLLAVELRNGNATTKRLLLTGLAGLVVIWFSQASVLMMAGIGLAFAVEWAISREQKSARALAITVPVWAAASLIAVVAGLRSMTPATREFMDDFWGVGFLPWALKPSLQLFWFWDRLTSLFADPTLLRYPWPALFLVVAATGAAVLWRRWRLVALFSVCPLLVCMIAAIAHQYPFRGRLILCLLPPVILLLGAGTDWLMYQASRLHPALGWLLVIVLLTPPAMALVAAPPPYDIEHNRTLLAYLQHNRQPGDLIYVFPLQRIGTQYYGPRFGLSPADWVSGICERDDTRRYIQDVDRFRGVPRVWFLSSGVRPFRTARSAIQKYLETIGIRKDSLSFSSLSMGSVGLELYDLSDPARLKAATSDTFPVPPMPTDPRPGCRDWAKPGPVWQPQH